ncbi:hypothetical protein BH09SUM1_BH09SUM1_02470 [soil metagenome]
MISGKGTIERLSFKGGQEHDELQNETIRLHLERYHFAAGTVAGIRVLDLACGVGYGSAHLAEAGAREVVGVDIAPEAIEEARGSYGRDNVHFICSAYQDLAAAAGGDGLETKLLAEPFDQIVSLETIEHLPSPQDFLATILPLLKPGGIFVGSVPVTPSMDANPYHLHDFTPGSFHKLLENAGLVIEESFQQRQPYNPFVVKKQMGKERKGLRSNLGAYYLSHPNKLALRFYASCRYGFVNIYEAARARKPQK